MDKKFPLLPRNKNKDKFAYGHALIIAGSRRMTGAAVLAATAALRAGAGLVTLASSKEAEVVLRRKLPPEIMFLPPKTQSVLSFIRRRRVNALAIGPGLTTAAAISRRVRRWTMDAPCALVLDADGLNAFRGRLKELTRRRGPTILTPHAREFERLFGIRCPEAGGARLRLAKKAAGRYHGVLVLKGRRTIVIQGRRFFVNPTGNPGLAKGGAGDALTGILAAFLAQGLSAFDAAVWAVYFHGKAADLAVRRTGELGLTASDVIEFLPKAFKKRGQARIRTWEGKAGRFTVCSI